MVVILLSHSNSDLLFVREHECQYCYGAVEKCNCEIFKRINDGRIPYNTDIDEWIDQFNEKNTSIFDNLRYIIDKFCYKTLPSLVVQRKIRRPQDFIIETPVHHSKFNNHFAETVVVDINKDSGTRSRRNSDIYKTLLLNISQTINNIIKTRNNLCEGLLGDYCPVHLRNTTIIDYDGCSYKKLQKALAKEKMLEQEGGTITKIVYNPTNKYIFWLFRPFNFDNDYSYSMFCEKALERRTPWIKYHQGCDRVQRKHFLRRWLNRKWQWETIIDYIFDELGPSSLDKKTISCKKNVFTHKTRNKDEHETTVSHIKEVIPIRCRQFSRHMIKQQNVSYCSSRQILLEDAFDTLLRMCTSASGISIATFSDLYMRTI